MQNIEVAFVMTVRQLVREVMPTILTAIAADSRPPTLKSDGSFVTEIDIAVERHLSAGLRRLFPDVSILGEEMSTDSARSTAESSDAFYATFLSAPSLVVIDPIDGTKNFVEGGKPFCIAAALVRSVNKGVWPVASVVVLPMSDMMFFTDNGLVCREVFSSGAVEVVERRVVTDKRISVNSSDRGWLAKNGFEMKLPWVSSGSSVYDFMQTATGSLCGSMVGKQRLWDLMAPLAIGERLGCVLRDLSTGEVVSCIRPSDLSRDLSNRIWGIERKMILAPRTAPVTDLIAPI